MRACDRRHRRRRDRRGVGARSGDADRGGRTRVCMAGAPPPGAAAPRRTSSSGGSSATRRAPCSSTTSPATPSEKSRHDRAVAARDRHRRLARAAVRRLARPRLTPGPPPAAAPWGTGGPPQAHPPGGDGAGREHGKSTGVPRAHGCERLLVFGASSGASAQGATQSRTSHRASRDADPAITMPRSAALHMS